MIKRIIMVGSTKFLIVVLFSVLIVACKASKNVSQIQTQSETIIQPNEKVNPLIKNLQNAHVGICIYDVEKKSFLESYQSDKYFIPASNLKIATCYAALKYLGDSIVGLKYY